MMVLELPIYYTFKYKTKKDKTVLVGINWYRNTHFQLETKVKKYYQALVRSKLSVKTEQFEQYKIHYKLFYKSKVCDASNIIPIIDKYLNDTIQEMGLLINDNVNYYKQSSWEVVGQDKENPRVEIELEEIL